MVGQDLIFDIYVGWLYVVRRFEKRKHLQARTYNTVEFFLHDDLPRWTLPASGIKSSFSSLVLLLSLVLLWILSPSSASVLKALGGMILKH